MASETFLKIAKLTKEMFIITNEKEQEPYVNELIRMIPENFKDLQPQQLLLVYEGIGHMVRQAPSEDDQKILVEKLMESLNKEWCNILDMANQNIEKLKQPDVLKLVDFFMKINQRVCEAVGSGYA
jgi:hypothetical protein